MKSLFQFFVVFAALGLTIVSEAKVIVIDGDQKEYCSEIVTAPNGEEVQLFYPLEPARSSVIVTGVKANKPQSTDFSFPSIGILKSVRVVGGPDKFWVTASDLKGNAMIDRSCLYPDDLIKVDTHASTGQDYRHLIRPSFWNQMDQYGQMVYAMPNYNHTDSRIYYPEQVHPNGVFPYSRMDMLFPGYVMPQEIVNTDSQWYNNLADGQDYCMPGWYSASLWLFRRQVDGSYKAIDWVLSESRLLGPEPILTGPSPVIYDHEYEVVGTPSRFWKIYFHANAGVDVMVYAIMRDDNSFVQNSNNYPFVVVINHPKAKDGGLQIHPITGRYEYLIPVPITDNIPAGKYKVIIQGVRMNWKYNAPMKYSEILGWNAGFINWPG